MNVARHVERGARWVVERPVILSEGAALLDGGLDARVSRLDNAPGATGKTLERVLRARP